MIPLFSFSPKVNFIQHASSAYLDAWILKVPINNHSIFVSCDFFKWVASSLNVHIAFEQHNAVSHNFFLCLWNYFWVCFPSVQSFYTMWIANWESIFQKVHISPSFYASIFLRCSDGPKWFTSLKIMMNFSIFSTLKCSVHQSSWSSMLCISKL